MLIGLRVFLIHALLAAVGAAGLQTVHSLPSPSSPASAHSVLLLDEGESKPDAPPYRLRGEFEHQGALLLASEQLMEEFPNVFLEIVAAVHQQMKILIMINREEAEAEARVLFAQKDIPTDDIYFVPVPHDTMWTRDYGPIVVESANGNLAVVDSRYGCDHRAQDEDAPGQIADYLHIPKLGIDLEIPGGNLLSNGEGLFVCTSRLLEANESCGGGEKGLRAKLRQLYGATQLVFLEALTGEPTGHVDMFASFVSAGTIVVGSYDESVDPVNAPILNRNAKKLAEISTRHGKLRVVRIPMPTNRDGQWRTYTNVVYANKVVLVPVYPDLDADLECRALDVLERLLPQRQIVRIDAHELTPWNGMLHCITTNLGPIGRIADYDEDSGRDRSSYLEVYSGHPNR